MALAKNAEIRVGNAISAISRGLAYAGGVVLAFIALTTVASVIGRQFLWLGLGPIKGDYELVEMGCAIAIFLFLPWCQFKRGHVTVDIFISRLPDRIQAVLGLIGDLFLTAAAYVILWRLWLGFGEKFPFGSDAVRGVMGMGSKPFFPESSYELEIPLWLPFGLCLIGATFFLIVAIFTVWRSLNWVLDGKEQHL